MAVYLTVVFSVTILCLAAQKTDYIFDTGISNDIVHHRRTTRLFFCIAAIVLIFVSSFRYGMGDYWAYYNGYSYYAGDLWRSIKELDEPGIRLICWLGLKITPNPQMQFVLESIIAIGLSMIVIYKHTDKLLMATMLFIFIGCWTTSFNAVRQCLAASVIFYGLDYIRERKFIKYAVVVFIAFLFHASAIVMIVLYFLVNVKASVRNAIVLVIISVIALNSFDLLFKFAGVILDKNLEGDMAYATKSVNTFRIAVAVVPALFELLLYSFKDRDETTSFYINLLVVHATFMLATSNSAYFARIGIYTAPFCCIAIPELNKNIDEMYKKYINTVMMLLYGLYWLYDVSGFNFSTSFNFIWQK